MNQHDRASPLDIVERELREITGQQYATLPMISIDVAAEPDIGKLSAEAVLEQYKMAAKSVEEMGEEVQKRILALQAAMDECAADLKLLAEAAAAIREKGKHAQAEIERTAAVSKDIREIIAEIKKKLT